jgi:hypothetical protein
MRVITPKRSVPAKRPPKACLAHGGGPPLRLFRHLSDDESHQPPRLTQEFQPFRLCRLAFLFMLMNRSHP